MGVEKNYYCNLCRERLSSDPADSPNKKPVGIYWMTHPKGWTVKPWKETENHICVPCLSSLQELPKICGQGYVCTGGVNCDSDHK